MVQDIKTAVMTGMFLRENRIDIAGNEQQTKLKKPPVKKSKEEEDKPATQSAEEGKTTETEDKGLF